LWFGSVWRLCLLSLNRDQAKAQLVIGDHKRAIAEFSGLSSGQLISAILSREISPSPWALENF